MVTALPNPEMMAAVERIARFMETVDDVHLHATFAKSDVTIIENFAPHIFQGPDAVDRWAGGFREHARGLTDLRHRFGPAQDFSTDGETAFFSLPTTWTGVNDGVRFSERGGWAFVLLREEEQWRVKSYGWAVTEFVQSIDK